MLLILILVSLGILFYFLLSRIFFYDFIYSYFNHILFLFNNFRTPIVTSNTSETIKTFNSAPEEIRSQYTSDLFVPTEAMLSLLEDPNLVVDTLVKALTLEYVPMWMFPGIQANYFLRSIYITFMNIYLFIYFFMIFVILYFYNSIFILDIIQVLQME